MGKTFLYATHSEEDLQALLEKTRHQLDEAEAKIKDLKSDVHVASKEGNEEALRELLEERGSLKGRIEDIDKLLSLAGDSIEDVHVECKSRVGTVRARMADGSYRDVWPVVEMIFDRDALPPIPRNLCIAWRDREDSPKVGRRRHIWIYTPEVPDSPFLTMRVDPEMRDIFERLRGLWDWWLLKITCPTREIHVQVCREEGIVYVLKSRIEDMLIHTREAPSGDQLFKRMKAELIERRKKQGTRLSREDHLSVAREARKTVNLLESIGGPLPWELYKETEVERRERAHKIIIEGYLSALRALWHSATDSSAVAPGFSIEGTKAKKLDKEHSSRAWAALKNARIFELTPEAYGALHHTADVYTTERIAGMKWKEGRLEDKRDADGKVIPSNGISKQQAEAHYKLVTEAGKKVPFPDQLPFDFCYFAWGEGVVLNEVNKMARGIPENVRAGIIAHLVTASGHVEEIIVFDPTNGAEHGGMMFVEHRAPVEGWLKPYLLTPWIISALVSGINEHRALVMEGKKLLDDSFKFKKESKSIARRLIPPPYYTVYMRDDLIKKSARKTFRQHQEVEWSHRWDVRGHEMVRVRRGQAPIDPKLETKLRNRGYSIFDAMTPPTAKVYAVLMSRGMDPPRQDEWIAVLITWRDAFVKGPKSKPYIPSVHKPTKGLVAKSKRKVTS